MVLTLYNSAKKNCFFVSSFYKYQNFFYKKLNPFVVNNDMNFKCRHANSHFEVEDEQLAKDLEFAQQLAFAPSSPPSMVSILSPLLFFLLLCLFK